MTVAEFIPIYVFLAISIFALDIAVIYHIRDRYVGISKEKDFLEKFIETKKRSMDSNLGGMSFKMYTVLVILCPVAVTLLIWFILKRPILAVVAGLFSVFLPELVLRFTVTKQKENFEERYAVALKTLAAGLESGLSVQQAVNEIANNPFIHDSIKRGFNQISSDIKVGISVPNAFRRFANDNRSEDAQDVASAIAMQSEVGGSEARVIEAIAGNIKDRIMMRREIKTLFTDTTVMVRVMDVLPFIMLGGFYFFAPQFIMPFFESVPRIIGFILLIGYMIGGSLCLHYKINTAKGGKL